MFFDPTCKPEVRADPFTLESLIAWLEKQSPHTRYNWHNCDGKCLIAVYGFAMGIDRLDADCPGIDKIFGEGENSKYAEVCGTLPFTYGAALDRARAAASRI